MKEIWVLGSKHLKAHKSIPWSPPFPNFSNADILIVNLPSLRKEQFQKIESEILNEARRYIFDMLMTGEKTVIVIMSNDRGLLNWLPIYPIMSNTAPVRLDKYPKDPKISNYLKNVEECCYYIRDFNRKYFTAKTDPHSVESERYDFTYKARDAYSNKMVADFNIWNAAKQIVGGAFKVQIFYGKKYPTQWEIGGWSYEGFHNSGTFTFLPPPTKVKVEEAIDALINVLIGDKVSEPSPPWEEEIGLPGLSDLKNQIEQKEQERDSLNLKINELKVLMGEKTRLRLLLWTEGEALEDLVKDAFTILGFPEIRKMRPSNLEDWIIDFKHIDEFKHGVFEIKAAEKRTSLADLTQCNKWVDDYLLEDIKVKGIFVPNQYRREDVRTNTKNREEFAPNELEYAQKREICILPTHEIFNAVVAKMAGNEKITREAIEKKIATANGLCKLLEPLTQ